MPGLNANLLVGIFFGVLIVAMARSLVFLVREWMLARELRQPPSCGRCGHGVTQSMLASGRCPECGTPYLIGGVDSPRRRLDIHERTSTPTSASVVLGLGVGILLGWVVSQFSQTFRFPSGVVYAPTATILSVVLVSVMRARRNRLERDLTRREAEWTAAGPGVTTHQTSLSGDHDEC